MDEASVFTILKYSILNILYIYDFIMVQIPKDFVRNEKFCSLVININKGESMETANKIFRTETDRINCHRDTELNIQPTKLISKILIGR